MKFILLMYVKIPTIVDTPTSISRKKLLQFYIYQQVKYKFECFKQKQPLFFRILVFMSNCYLVLCWFEHEKFYIIRRPDHMTRSQDFSLNLQAFALLQKYY